LCQLAIANNDRQKKVFACPIRHLHEQKFRIILNIVLIVNEFECFVLFPAAPIFLLLLLLLCRSPRRRLFLFDGVGSLLCKAFTFSFFLALLTRSNAEPQQKTLEAAWKKIQLCAQSRERAREEEKELLNGKSIHTRKKRGAQHTNMQKSHFYSCFGPLPPCSPARCFPA
jgi:hypothetical protein